jgi:uncharacterized protein YcfL
MKMIQRHAPLLLAALLLSACTSTGKGGPQRTLQGSEGLPGMTELDGGQTLRNDLDILHVVSTRKGDYLVVQFELHNKRGGQINLEWNVDWFDETGLLVGTNENWRPLAIGGRGFEMIQITAPTPAADSWRLKVQKPNPVR